MDEESKDALEQVKTESVPWYEWTRRTDLEKPCEYWLDNLEINND